MKEEGTHTHVLPHVHNVHSHYLVFSWARYFSLIITKWGCCVSDRTLLQVTQLISGNARILSLVYLTPNTTVHSTTWYKFKCMFYHLLIVWLKEVNERLWNAASLSWNQMIMSHLRRVLWELNELTHMNTWSCAWPIKCPTCGDDVLGIFKPKPKLGCLSSQTGFKYL